MNTQNTSNPEKKPVLKVGSANKKADLLFKNGDIFGLYRIIRLLTKSETGELYMCEHTVTSKKYTLRVFSKELTESPEFRERFTTCKQFLPRYIHPNIVHVHEINQDNGIFFIVSDYIESKHGHPLTLEDELKMRPKFTESEAQKIILSLCKALSYLHNFSQHPIVHSDLKPSNILFNKNGDVMLSDINILYIIGVENFRNLVKKALIRSVEEEKKSGDKHQTTDDVSSDTEEPSEIERTASFLLLDKSKSKRSKEFEVMTTFGKQYLKEIIHKPGVLFENENPESAASEEEEHFSFPSGIYKQIDGSISSALSTFDYMSPEQKSGKPLTPQSNIYSLGLILYKMLTGHKISGTWKLPSVYGCNSAWDPVVLRCVKHKPEERYQSVRRLQYTIYDIYGHKKKILWAILAAMVLLASVFIYLSLQAGSKVNRLVRIIMKDERGDSVKILEEAKKQQEMQQVTETQVKKTQKNKKYVRVKGKWKKQKWTERVSSRYKKLKK